MDDGAVGFAIVNVSKNKMSKHLNDIEFNGAFFHHLSLRSAYRNWSTEFRASVLRHKPPVECAYLNFVHTMAMVIRVMHLWRAEYSGFTLMM